MRGIAESMEVFTSFDQNQWKKYLISKASGHTVPNLVAQIVDANDPYMRKVVDYWQEIVKKSNLEERRNLPRIRGIDGRAIEKQWMWGSPWGRFTGIGGGKHKPDPVADELFRLQMHFSGAPNKVRGIKLDEHQHDRYQALAGYALKMPAGTFLGQTFPTPAVRTGENSVARVDLDLSGLGMYEALGQLIKQPGYTALSDGEDGQKARLIQAIQSRYREVAQARMFAEYPALQDELVAEKTEGAVLQGIHPEVAARAADGARHALRTQSEQAMELEVFD
jgi:hypothetical protein